MPIRNVPKVFVNNSFYHVYNRGWNLGKVFLDEDDYNYFESLLAKYLSPEQTVEKSGKVNRHFYPEVHLLAYCLMGNHFHMLLYQYSEETAITRLMKSVMASYSAYFNRKYNRRGALFESTYKAVRIDDDVQLQHITRYIHLNHARYETWKHSSYGDYIGTPRPWVDSSPILELFSSVQQYEEFVADYEEVQRERDDIKRELYGR